MGQCVKHADQPGLKFWQIYQKMYLSELSLLIICGDISERKWEEETLRMSEATIRKNSKAFLDRRKQ